MQWLETVIKEQYRIVKILKQTSDGAKSVLWLRHNEQGKDMIKRTFVGTAEVYQILRSVSHPNLPTIFEVVIEGETVTVLEEYVDGTTVSDILETGRYHEDGVKQVVHKVCEALEALHTLNIIHRDIKPENIMITTSGQVILIDFDAAKLYKPHRSKDTAILGTSGYAAPEQFGITQSDKRADIYAIGVLMNVMLTGEHPSKKLYHGKLTKMIEKCIQVDPNKRYQSAGELKQKLK